MEETKLVENYIQIIQDSLSAPMKSDSIYQRKRKKDNEREKTKNLEAMMCLFADQLILNNVMRKHISYSL